MKKFKYQEIVSNIENDIFPELLSGELLPSERELCKRYKVSSITIKKALSLLADGNMIKRIPGKGTVYNANQTLRVSNSFTGPKKTVTRVLTLNNWASADLIERLCNDFAKLNPEIKFEFHRVGHLYFDECVPDNYDLIFGNTWLIREYMTNPEYQDYFLPVEDLSGLLIDKDILFPEAVKWCSKNGRMFCLPLCISPVFAMFNMNYPKFSQVPFRDYETFEDFCSLMYDLKMDTGWKENYFPLFMPLQKNRWSCFVKMQRGEFFDPDTNLCVLDSPETVNAIKMIQKWFDDRIIPPLAFNWKELGSDLFYENRIACMLGSYKHLRKNINFEHNLKYHMLPASKTNCSSHLLLEGMLVTRTCSNVDIVAKLLNFLQNSENQIKICREADGFSAQKELAKLFLQNLAINEPSIMNILEQVKYAKPTFTSPRIAKWRRLSEILPKLWMGIDKIKKVSQEIKTIIDRI